MKKFILLLVTAVFVLSFASMGAAAGKKQAVPDERKAGTITAVDAKAGTMVFCPEGTKNKMTLKADKAQLAKFKPGAKVVVMVNGDTATTIAVNRGAKIPVGC